MDSIENDRDKLPSAAKKDKAGPSHDKKKISPVKNTDGRTGQMPDESVPNAGLFEQSPSSTVKDLQRKLD